MYRDAQIDRGTPRDYAGQNIVHWVATTARKGVSAVVRAIGVDVIAGEARSGSRLLRFGLSSRGEVFSVAEAELKQTIHRLVEERMSEGPINSVIADLFVEGKSTRQIEAELKSRSSDMDHSTVARRIKRVRETVRADSSGSILREGSSQPRDTKNRPIADAQPEDDDGFMNDDESNS